MSTPHCILRIAQDFDGQDPKIQAARTRERRGIVCKHKGCPFRPPTWGRKREKSRSRRAMRAGTGRNAERLANVAVPFPAVTLPAVVHPEEPISSDRAHVDGPAVPDAVHVERAAIDRITAIGRPKAAGPDAGLSDADDVALL